MNIADRLQACHSAVVHDVMKDLGLGIRVLPRSIGGLEPTMKAAGPVFTVRGRPDPTLDKHSSLYEWAGLLSRAPSGHVVVCQPQDDTRALFGGLSAEALAIKGVRGYIVDGGCRDVQAVADQGFPVFARFRTPIDIVCAWRAEAFGEPIANFQLIQAMLADSDIEIYAAECMMADVSARADAGENVLRKAAAFKVFASEMCGRVVDRVVQIYGGAGYLAEYDAERFFRDARIYRIYEGTTQILQLQIAKHMLREFSAL